MEALGRQADFILNYVKYNGQEKPHDDKNWLSLLSTEDFGKFPDLHVPLER